MSGCWQLLLLCCELQTAVRPYLMDLGTTNGTFLNGERIESERFYELLLKVCVVALNACLMCGSQITAPW